MGWHGISLYSFVRLGRGIPATGLARGLLAPCRLHVRGLFRLLNLRVGTCEISACVVIGGSMIAGDVYHLVKSEFVRVHQTILLWLLFLPFLRMEKSKNKPSLPKTTKVLLFMKVKSQPMIKDLLRIGAQFVGYREYASKTEEKLAEANERANTLAQQLEHSEKARKKAELDATEARAEADKAKADAAGVEDLRKRLHTAETSLSDHIAAQSAREEAILKRLRTHAASSLEQLKSFNLKNPQ
ncbi:hypothetical protein QYE76_032560 [Lolium multiflorum]|uniref:Uncharacterized protein n=1 Tax=Lolium multiflorum TaxID=4521 RepID=A0AAD8QUC0_LOLMU|nr:hypothetical protein QYE76_032560 [Lolium multiflorum]